MHKLTLEGLAQPLELPPQRTILDACLERGVPLPYNCRSGECGECLAQLISGQVRELPGADPAIYTPALREAGMVLTCLCYAQSDLHLRVPLRQDEAPRIQTFDAVVTEVAWCGPFMARVTVRTSQPVSFEAGQYFEWHLSGLDAPRSYSAASAPGGAQIEFLVRLHPGGGVSRRLQQAEIAAGDVLQLKGPFGHYALDPLPERPLVMVAGGAGLAPVLCIAQELAARSSRRAVKIFFGARDQAELACADALASLATRSASLQWHAALSQEPPDSGWNGPRGMITDLLQARLGDAFGAQAYVCGPPPMVSACVAMLQAHGVDRHDIHCDKFAPAAARQG